jgi:hypothetical protein
LDEFLSASIKKRKISGIIYLYLDKIKNKIGEFMNKNMTIEELKVKNLKNEKTIELVEFMKKNFMSEEGDIYVDGMDFSQFEGNVYINNSIFLNDVSFSHAMVIKGDFYCECNNVGGSIYQTMQKSGNRISQNGHSAYNGILEGGHIVKTPQVRVEPQLRGTFAAKTPE